jgi:hypothetical protein
LATPAIAFKQLADELQKDGLNPKNAVRVAGEIARTLNVKDHEVGILRLEKQMLHFVHPAKLATVGALPVNTSIAVAARVVSTKKPEVINSLAQTKHASVFESVELQKRPKVVGQQANPEEKLAHVIQKMMSVPIIGQAGVVGVIEVSRKGKSAPEAGADFSPADLQKLVTIASSLARCFK